MTERQAFALIRGEPAVGGGRRKDLLSVKTPAFGLCVWTDGSSQASVREGVQEGV